jgi:hypothetical protein
LQKYEPASDFYEATGKAILKRNAPVQAVDLEPGHIQQSIDSSNQHNMRRAKVFQEPRGKATLKTSHGLEQPISEQGKSE